MRDQFRRRGAVDHVQLQPRLQLATERASLEFDAHAHVPGQIIENFPIIRHAYRRFNHGGRIIDPGKRARPIETDVEVLTLQGQLRGDDVMGQPAGR